MQFQFIRVIFENRRPRRQRQAHETEFDAYFDLQGHFYGLGVGITPSIQTPSLFQLLDENRRRTAGRARSTNRVEPIDCARRRRRGSDHEEHHSAVGHHPGFCELDRYYLTRASGVQQP